VAEEKMERPWATLYIFQRKGKIVAVAIGQVPPTEGRSRLADEGRKDL
jgi:hypothetical protein